MGGRFLSVPFLLSLLILTQFHWRRWWVIMVVITCFGLSAPEPSLYSTSFYGTQDTQATFWHGIYDERADYYQHTGLFAPFRRPFAAKDIQKYRETQRHNYPFYIMVEERIGMKGYLAGPDFHIVDPLALADPLLSHLPRLQFSEKQNLRMAHFIRFIPNGYIASLSSGDNQIWDEGLKEYYQKIYSITRDDIFSLNRCKNVLATQLGIHDSLIKQDRYRTPPRFFIEHQTLSNQNTTGRLWFHPQNVFFFEQGIVIQLEQTVHAKQLAFGLDQYNEYAVTFIRENKNIASKPIYYRPSYRETIEIETIEVPEKIARVGYSAVWVYPLTRGNARHAIASVQIQ